MRTNLLKLINRINLKEDVRYNPKTGDLNPDYGYLVPIVNTEAVVFVDLNDIRSYMRRNKQHIYKPNRYVGIYHAPNAYLLTINELVESMNDARLLATIRKDKFIYDNANTEIIYFDK